MLLVRRNIYMLLGMEDEVQRQKDSQSVENVLLYSVERTYYTQGKGKHC